MTKVRTFTFSSYQTNSYIAYSEREAVLVDASASEPHEREMIEAFIQAEGLEVRHLLLTHAHVDHVFGCAHFARTYNKSWTAHRDSVNLMRFAKAQAALFGTRVKQPPTPSIFVQEGDVVSFGLARWEVLYTPGHAPGSICFYDREAGFVMAGDVLFRESIGRYDLPGGNLPTLMESIHQKLLPLPVDTVVYSGHGPPTTIGHERMYNPFLGDASSLP